MICKICGRDDSGYPAIGITITKWKGPWDADGKPIGAPDDWNTNPKYQPHACNPEAHARFTKIMFDAVKGD